MNNRIAFTDFVRGLLTLNPLERWSPQQAKLHPFITQQKFTQPFVPPMNLKSSVLNKSVSPGVQQQQQAEAASKQRAAQEAQAQAQSAYALQLSQYNQASHNQAPPVYNSVYSGHQQGPPPPYPSQPNAYGHQIPMMQGQGHVTQQQYPPSQSLYAQATTRAGRQRSSTMDQQQSGIPQSIQRVASHLDPNAPIRLQPSPAYYPPPADGYQDANSRRRGSRAGASGSHGRSRDVIRNLEDGALGDGFGTQNQWR